MFVAKYGVRERDGIFLKIIRREHVVVGSDEGLKEAPGAARDASQCIRVFY